MAKIPTYIRQQKIPSTTGMVGLPNLKIDDHIGNALTFAGKIADTKSTNLINAQAATEVATASSTAMIGMSKLETDLAQHPGIVASGMFDKGAKEVFDKSMALLATKKGQAAFAAKFPMLAATSKIKVNTAATARSNSQIDGNLTNTIDNALNDIGVKTTPYERMIELSLIEVHIESAVTAGAITFKEGAARLRKYKERAAKNGILSWINTPGQNLMRTIDEMEEEKFTGANAALLQKDWNNLLESEKLKLRGQASTLHSSQMQVKAGLQAAEEKAIKEKQKINAANIISKIARSKLTPKELSKEAGKGVDLVSDPTPGAVPTIVELQVMMNERKISTSDHNIILKMLGPDNAETSPVDLNNLQELIREVPNLPEEKQEAAFKTIENIKKSLILNNRLKNTHVNMINSLIEKVTDKAYKSSDAYRYRNDLQIALFGRKNELAFNINDDPSKKERFQTALREYDALVEEGVAPKEAYNRMLKRAMPGRDLSYMLPPKYNPSGDELSEWTLAGKQAESSMFATNNAIKNKLISKTQFIREMGRLEIILERLKEENRLEKLSDNLRKKNSSNGKVDKQGEGNSLLKFFGVTDKTPQEKRKK